MSPTAPDRPDHGDPARRSDDRPPSGLSRERALSFGSAAERYERFRPGYPDVVADLVLAGLGDATRLHGLEIGAGTGKATRLLAGRGVRVTAVEPDPLMRDVLVQACTGLPVDVVPATLETLPPSVTDPPYDVLYAAASWHWTDPATRWERAAALLVEGGVFASFGGPLELVDPAVREEVARIRSAVIASDEVRPAEVGGRDGALRWPGSDLAAVRWFTEVEERDLAMEGHLSADDFVGLLSTVSAYLVLSPEARELVLTEIRAALPEEVAVRRDLVLHRARRTGLAVAVAVAEGVTPPRAVGCDHAGEPGSARGVSLGVPEREGHAPG